MRFKEGDIVEFFEYGEKCIGEIVEIDKSMAWIKYQKICVEPIFLDGIKKLEKQDE